MSWNQNHKEFFGNLNSNMVYDRLQQQMVHVRGYGIEVTTTQRHYPRFGTHYTHITHLEGYWNGYIASACHYTIILTNGRQSHYGYMRNRDTGDLYWQDIHYKAADVIWWERDAMVWENGEPYLTYGGW